MDGAGRGLAAIWRQPRLATVLGLGFASGLPLPLTFGTLSFWLAESGVSRTAIGLFALVGTAYSLKFLWAPLVDSLPLPVLTGRFGRRRGWTLAVQAALIAAIALLGLTDPAVDPALTAMAALAVAFLSATQDIVIDAYRIELLEPEEQGMGAAAIQWGYRGGMLAASAGALYAAAFGGWAVAYAVMASLMLVGVATVLLSPEPARPPHPLDPAAQPPSSAATGGLARAAAWARDAVVAPFAEFARRPGWLAILLFVVLYKLGDALAGVMANPFYVALGFTKIEVANVAKLFGVAATLAGLAVAGLIVYRWGVYRSLLVCGLLQAASNLTYVLQAWAGHDVWVLTLTILLENFTGGMGSAAFVAYLSGLCSLAFTATQYALLSSLAAVGRTTLSASGGWLADRLDWVPFFLATTAAALPALLILLWLGRRFPIDPPAAARPATR
ncbi:PAT family beta-lactamase induction signal transducer AmpG [Stella humosa]|uniref:PAT family beta-lactamase induction signal transducer AmpG n=1 Tax=Stella humosa TaxID=94 RepID=A0A3N1KYX5_9PROT|nr:MFS transporter [Stella humosa]ROP84367.1 PAT family beta-lactamase induction signal transducer AmpG [Stella humosa]